MSVRSAAPVAADPRSAARWTPAVPLGIFLLTRVLDGLVVAWFARDQVASTFAGGEGWFTVHPVPASPGYLAALANFDGQWYQQVAEHGYPSTLPVSEGEVAQNAWAFFPAFPALVRLVMALSGLPFEVAATVVSTTCGAVAVCLLHRMLVPLGGRFNAAATVLALCTFPAAVVLQAGYTESLALLALVLLVGALRSRRYDAVAAVTLLLALTRPIVLPVAVVITVHGLVRWRHERSAFPLRERAACALAALWAAASFLLWPAVAAVVTGRADAYLATQRAWVTQDGVSGYRSWASHALAGPSATAVLGLVALSALTFVVTRRRAAAWGPEWRAWALAYGVYLFLATRPIASVVRMALLAVVPWWPVPEPPHGRVWSVRTRATVLVGIATLGLCSQWLWVQWFFIPRVGSVGAP